MNTATTSATVESFETTHNLDLTEEIGETHEMGSGCVISCIGTIEE